ncbi:nicotinate-nucleotide--dimethylbenzimidazole phosphoribosyltransferase [Chloroflexota bacterium]
MSKLSRIISEIQPLDEEAMHATRVRQNTLTKPLGSLGRLEELSVRVAGIKANPLPKIHNKAIMVMVADHGVVSDGVTPYPQEVTAQMVKNFLGGGAGINVLAGQIGARVVIVDIGVNAELPAHSKLLIKKVAKGTNSIAQCAAMTKQQAIDSIEVGINVLEGELSKGLDIVGTGDMGIGNTTASSAICAAITGESSQRITGRGTGIDDEMLAHKARIVNQSLEINRPNPEDALDVLSKVGGFEIGGIAGVILAGAAHRIPVVIDGFISGAGALIAIGLAPITREYLIAAHVSAEPGHRVLLNYLGLQPLLDLGMRLGEGTGACLGMYLTEAATRIVNDMATFKEAGVSEAQEA